MLHHTSAQRFLAAPKSSEDVLALREIFADVLSLPDTNRFIAGMMSGLGDEARVPDFDLMTAEGPARLAELLRPGRGVLVDLTGSVHLPEEWADRVDLVRGKASQDLDAILLRPDGAACWRGEGPLEPALRATFG